MCAACGRAQTFIRHEGFIIDRDGFDERFSAVVEVYVNAEYGYEVSAEVVSAWVAITTLADTAWCALRRGARTQSPKTGARFQNEC